MTPLQVGTEARLIRKGKRRSPATSREGFCADNVKCAEESRALRQAVKERPRQSALLGSATLYPPPPSR